MQCLYKQTLNGKERHPFKTFLVYAKASNAYVLLRTAFSYMDRKTYDDVYQRHLIGINN